MFVSISECKGADNHSLWLGSTGNSFLQFAVRIILGHHQLPEHDLRIYDILDSLRWELSLQKNSSSWIIKYKSPGSGGSNTSLWVWRKYQLNMQYANFFNTTAFPSIEERVQNTMRSGVFLTTFKWCIKTQKTLFDHIFSTEMRVENTTRSGLTSLTTFPYTEIIQRCLLTNFEVFENVIRHCLSTNKKKTYK